MSQIDRYSDAFGIAKRSQTIADTETDSETDSETASEAASATEGRTPYKNSPSIHSVTYVTRGAAAPIVTPSPLAHPDAMDGLTISLSDMPDIGGDGPPLCETALHCDSAIPADYLVQFTDPVLVDEWGDFVWPICTQCHGRGSRIEGDVEAWRIVQVLR